MEKIMHDTHGVLARSVFAISLYLVAV